ncbi:MAG: hypothetical protein HY922_07300 [Elusimicrobia bacterium]|nr:hypothetical protein [Elusimicrobiota bacterium]
MIAPTLQPAPEATAGACPPGPSVRVPSPLGPSVIVPCGSFPAPSKLIALGSEPMVMVWPRGSCSRLSAAMREFASSIYFRRLSEAFAMKFP